MLYNLDNLMEWTKLNSKRDVIKALQRLGVPFAELHNGEVVTLYSAIEKGFNDQLIMEGEKPNRICPPFGHKYQNRQTSLAGTDKPANDGHNTTPQTGSGVHPAG